MAALTDAERARHSEVALAMRSAVAAVVPVSGGYRLDFDTEAGSGRILQLAEFVALESRCCAFLTFNIQVATGTPGLALTMTGPAGTAAFLQGELGLTA
jgi:hypothetical protein